MRTEVVATARASILPQVVAIDRVNRDLVKYEKNEKKIEKKRIELCVKLKF